MDVEMEEQQPMKEEPSQPVVVEMKRVVVKNLSGKVVKA